MKTADCVAYGIVFMAAAAAACAGDRASPDVSLLDYGFAIPASWEARPPDNETRLAEFTVPAPGRGEPAEVIVYHFGPGQGTDADKNIERWASQFSTPGGGPITPLVAELAGAPFRTIIVDFAGNYAAAGVRKTDQALTAAVIETPRGNLIAHLIGPAQTVRAARNDFIDFVASVRDPAGGAS